MYLWHWPVIVLLFYAVPQLSGTTRLIIVTTVTVAVAAVSYRFLERPVISMHLGPWLRSIPTTVRTGLLAVVAAGTIGCVTACALAPSMTTTERLLLEAQEASEASAPAAPSAPATSTPTLTQPTPEATQTAEEAATSANPQPTSPAETQAEADSTTALGTDGLPEGSQITFIGDSVMLACKPALQAAFPGAYVDAAQNRRDSQALGPDQLHPTAAGSQYYAQAVAEALRQAAAG